MSNQAAELLRKLAEAPVPVQREVAAAVLKLQFSTTADKSRRTLHIRQIAGKYRPQPASDAKPHDRWYAEAIQTSKAAEPNS
jgi:hypothetical protein